MLYKKIEFTDGTYYENVTLKFEHPQFVQVYMGNGAIEIVNVNYVKKMIPSN